MNLVRPGNPVTGRVVSNELCMKGKSASFVKHLVIDVSGTALAGNFCAGQSFGVIPPGIDARGKPHKVRLYSIACASAGEDGKSQRLSTTPKRLIEEYLPRADSEDHDDHHLFLGVCSNYLCDLKPGDKVHLSGPNGKRFLLPKASGAHNYLFFATGTGIAPFRGMLLELLENTKDPCPARIELVMGAPYSTDLLYDDLFTGLAAQHPNFVYHTAISRESGSRKGGRYVDGLLNSKMDHFGPLIESPETLIYVCGLTGMRTGLYGVLVQHDLDAGYIEIDPELRATPPHTWTAASVRKGIRPTARCLIEVY